MSAPSPGSSGDTGQRCRRLIDVRDGRLSLLEAVADYETKMRSYASRAVEASLENQGAQNLLYRPVSID